MSDPCAEGWCNVVLARKLPKDAAAAAGVSPPEVPEERYAVPAVLAGAGVLAAVTGGAGIVVGLALIVVAVLLAGRIRQQVEGARAALARWQQTRVCMACDRRMVPGVDKV